MQSFSNNDLRELSPDDIKGLKIQADKGDSLSQCKLALCYIYGQVDGIDFGKAVHYLELASEQEEPLSTLMLGMCYENGFVSHDASETSVSLSKAIHYYSKGYFQWNSTENSLDTKSNKNTDNNKFSQFSFLRDSITSIIAIRDFCSYSNDKFSFKFTDAIKSKIDSMLPALSKEIAEYGNSIQKQKYENDTEKAQYEYQYQDLLQMPVDVIMAAAGRNRIYTHLKEKSFCIPTPNLYLDWAMGRCLIDDNDKEDNDYIISGLRIIAGHDHDPLWEYRTALWYEFDPESKDLQEACLWYESAKDSYEPASKGLDRLKMQLEYQMIDDSTKGTATDCRKIADSYHQNRELANAWIIEAAIRGDESSLKKLEQLGTFQQKEDISFPLFYEIINKQYDNLKNTRDTFTKDIKNDINKAEDELVRKRKEEEKAVEERKRKEIEEQEALRRKEIEKTELEKKNSLLKEIQNAYTYVEYILKGTIFDENKSLSETNYDKNIKTAKEILSTANKKKYLLGGDSRKEKWFSIEELCKEELNSLILKIEKTEKAKNEYVSAYNDIENTIKVCQNYHRNINLSSSITKISSAVDDIIQKSTNLPNLLIIFNKAEKSLIESLNDVNKQQVSVIKTTKTTKLILTIGSVIAGGVLIYFFWRWLLTIILVAILITDVIYFISIEKENKLLKESGKETKDFIPVVCWFVFMIILGVIASIWDGFK